MRDSAHARGMKTTGTRFRDAVDGLIDLVLPLRCAGCDQQGTAWCAECAREFGGLRRVERPLFETGPPVFALGRYGGAARRAVVAYKESGRRDMAEPFGRSLATGLRGVAAELGVADETWWLVPAPSRRVAARRRGGAHMLRAGHRAAGVFRETSGSARVADCLGMRAGVRDSAGLDPAERVRNLEGSVRCRTNARPPPEAPAVLIDDVITTGATVASCLRALHETRVVAVLSLTATLG